MAAFEKDLIENLRGNISVSIHSETVVNLFYERTILLFCLEVAFNIPLKKRANMAFFKYIFRSINWSIVASQKEANRQLFCVLENSYTSGTQDTGVTKYSPHCLADRSLESIFYSSKNSLILKLIDCHRLFC